MEFPNIPKSWPIALDFETTGLKYWADDFRILQAAISVTHCDVNRSWAFDLTQNSQAARWLRDFLPGRRVIAQFAQFEAQCCRSIGIDPYSIDWYCTMTAACLINEHELTYDLHSICAQNDLVSAKRENLWRIMDALGVDTASAALARLADAPPDLVAMYVAGDAEDASRVFHAQQVEIDKQDLHRVVRLESDLVPVLSGMSWTGVRVDLERAHAAIPLLDESAEILQSEVNQIAGGKFNVNSTPQIRAIFKPEPVNRFQWRLVDGTLVGPTKSRKQGGGDPSPSIDQNALREMRHPLAEKILALRKTIKLRDTFIRGHVIGSADGNGYVHTTFNQTRNDQDAGTVTGRLSSTDPALQQITKRDKKNAAILRAMFLPDPGQQWLCEDYSQVDFRCGAHLQNDPSVIRAYQDNPDLDYHMVVSKMTGIPRNPPHAGAPNTKQINLGLSFGAGSGKLAFMMGMPYTIRESRGRMQYLPGPEAAEIFDLYHSKLPAVKQFMKKAENVAKDSHYVKTAIGRRLRFPRGFGAHKAAGLLYQAYAADLHKIGLVAVDRVIREEKLDARLMMSCHDEVGISAPDDPYIKERTRSVYTNFNSESSQIKMRVPITASANYGANWWEASKD
jgi:DNA polymerase I-like protein with 3'-5' exonuclease and polymerase domains